MNRLFAVTLLSGLSGPALAQPVTVLPDLVVTATHVPTPLADIPAGVTVIDQATILGRGYATLADALADVPGLRIVPSGGPGGNASVFIRGTNSDHVLVLRDGMPLNDPSDPGGAFNFGTETLADVQRIEIVRGPMSSLYGSGAVGGVINLITRKGSGAPHGSVTLGYGLPRAVLGAADLAGRSGRVDYSLGVEQQTNRGSDTTPRRESVYTGARNGFSTTVATVDLGYRPIAGVRVSLFLRGRQAAFGLDELGFPAYDARNYRGADNALNGHLAVDAKLLGGRLDTHLVLFRLQTDRHYAEPLEAADPNASAGYASYHGRRTMLQWTNTLAMADRGPARATSLSFGVVHIVDSSNSALNTVSGGFAYASSVRAHATSDAADLGGQTTLWRHLTITANLRGESASHGGNAATWRIGGVLAIPRLSSRIHAAIGTAFRAPSLYDLFGLDSAGYVGNPALRPERSLGWEFGWALDIAGFGRARLATVDITYFRNDIHDLIDFVYGPGFTTSTEQNIGHARTQGVEASLALHPATWLDATLSYTYTDARDLGTGAALLRRPREAISLGAVARPLPGLSIAPTLTYTGAFQDYLTDNGGFPVAVGQAHPGAILDLAATYRVRPNLSLFATGHNIFGSRFEPASGFATPGPSVLAGLRASF